MRVINGKTNFLSIIIEGRHKILLCTENMVYVYLWKED